MLIPPAPLNKGGAGRRGDACPQEKLFQQALDRMKAILMTAVDVLQLQQVPTPEISQPHQVLVALKAAGVNPIDTKIRKRGTFYPEQMPAILGCDGAGIVEAVGAAVQDFRPGDEVYFCSGGLGRAGTGNYAEYALIEADYLAHKPKSLSFAEAAAVPLVLITAWEALYDRARLQSGQSVLIHGGAGGVGHVAIQLAKLRGLKFIQRWEIAIKSV